MEIRLDSQKLIYHPKLVSQWLDGEVIPPLYSEISLTSACQFRCIYCAPNFFLNYKSEYLNTDTIKFTLTNMADYGVKAIMFGGEGESTLHKDFAEIVKHAKESGLDVALTTNGILYDEHIAKKTLPYLSWLKFSMDSGNAEVYAKMHGTRKSNIKVVFDNVIKTMKLRNDCGYECTVGGQAILLKENVNSILPLAQFLKTINADYLVIKPFSDHEKRIGDELELPTEEEITNLLRDIESFNIKEFKVIFREIAFRYSKKPRTYYKCYAQDFMAYIDSLGGIHSCINFIDDDKFTYGNIYEDTFENIWENKHEIKPNLNRCRDVCRLDLVNRYLWELKNPNKDANFI